VSSVAWTHLIFEAYCVYKSSKDKVITTYALLEDGTVSKKGEKQKNPVYIKGCRPFWCRWSNNKKDSEFTPTPECVYDKCPFLGLVEVEKKEYKAMIKAWEKECK
jgi:hypothetical protein